MNVGEIIFVCFLLKANENGEKIQNVRKKLLKTTDLLFVV